MKNKAENITKDLHKSPKGKKISRKEAIKKSSYMTFSAAAMIIFFDNSAHAASPAAPNNNNSTPNKPAGIWND